MLKVGLTGGIACGKSHALKEFGKLGVFCIDADRIAHQVIEPGKPAYFSVIEAFGQGILTPEKKIDRGKLGALVFSDSRALEQLNEIVHPQVYAEEARIISEIKSGAIQLHRSIVMVDAALMVETGSYKKYEVVITVYCYPEIQVQRLMTRNCFDREEALQRIQTQMPLLEKVKYADFVIETSGTLAETNLQVRQLYAELLNLYQERSNS